MILDVNCKEKIIAGYSKAKNKNMVFSHAEIINCFLEMEKKETPFISWYNYKTGEPETPKGFIIWSLFDGCGVVYRRADGVLILLTGRQGDFCSC